MKKGCFYLRVNDVSIRGEGDDFPRVDLLLTEESVILHAEVPGVAREAMEVKIDSQNVNLYGTRVEPESFPKATNFYKLESFYGTFQRSIKLPVEVVPGKAEVVLEKGILTVRIPRHRPKIVKIPVQ